MENETKCKYCGGTENGDCQLVYQLLDQADGLNDKDWQLYLVNVEKIKESCFHPGDLEWIINRLNSLKSGRIPLMSKELSIEIGPRDRPTIGLLRSDLQVGGSILYVEKREVWIRNLKERVSEYNWIVQGLSHHLPLADGSVGLIFAKDFFGADGRDAMVSPPPNLKFDYEIIGTSHAKEWLRVCRKEGRIIIVESATPPSIDYIKKQFIEVGFKLEEENLGGDCNRVFKNGLLPTFFVEDYSLVFKKK